MDLYQTWFQAKNLKAGLLAEIDRQLCYIHGVIQDTNDLTICIQFYRLDDPYNEDYCYLNEAANIRVWLKY